MTTLGIKVYFKESEFEDKIHYVIKNVATLRKLKQVLGLLPRDLPNFNLNWIFVWPLTDVH
jgi:hypothetical protein